MNKGQLIEMLGMRLGMDKKVAADAVDGMFDIIVRNVTKGENVTLTGFGVFEKRARAARTARNPRTGESLRLKRTNVPNFRPGTLFKEVVDGTRKLPRVGAARAATPAAATPARPAAKATASRTATRRPAAAKRSTTTRSATTRTAAAKKPARATAAKATAKATRPATKKAATVKKTAAAKKAKPAAKKRTKK